MFVIFIFPHIIGKEVGHYEDVLFILRIKKGVVLNLSSNHAQY